MPRDDVRASVFLFEIPASECSDALHIDPLHNITGAQLKAQGLSAATDRPEVMMSSLAILFLLNKASA